MVVMKATADKTWARTMSSILKTGKRSSKKKGFHEVSGVSPIGKKRKSQFSEDLGSSKKKVSKYSKNKFEPSSKEDFFDIDGNNAECDLDSESEDWGSVDGEQVGLGNQSSEGSAASESEASDGLEQLNEEKSEESDEESEEVESSDEEGKEVESSEESNNECEESSEQSESNDIQNKDSDSSVEEQVEEVESSSDEEMSDEDNSANNKVHCSEESDESESSEKVTQETSTGAGNEAAPGNPGWADAMAKILKMKKPKKKKVLVLSRAKKDFQVKPKPDFEVVGESQETKKIQDAIEKNKTDEETSASRKKLDKFYGWERVGRVKPNVLNKNRERMLCKIATQGVVQLFNTFKDQKKPMMAKGRTAGAKKKSIQKDQKIDRRAFLDMLKGSAKSIPVKGRSEEQPSWGVLRDDFTKSAKMRDWDKDQEEDDDEDDREIELEME